jgi:hypothetical protein
MYFFNYANPIKHWMLYFTFEVGTPHFPVIAGDTSSSCTVWSLVKKW